MKIYIFIVSLLLVASSFYFALNIKSHFQKENIFVLKAGINEIDSNIFSYGNGNNISINVSGLSFGNNSYWISPIFKSNLSYPFWGRLFFNLSPSPNILPNGDFENICNDSLCNWTFNSHAGINYSILYDNNTYLRILFNNFSSQLHHIFESEKITFEKGKIYEIYGYMKCSKDFVETGGRISINIPVEKNGTWNFTVTSSLPECYSISGHRRGTVNEWKMTKIAIFEIPDDNAVYEGRVRLTVGRIFEDVNVSGIVEIDNIFLKEVDSMWLSIRCSSDGVNWTNWSKEFLIAETSGRYYEIHYPMDFDEYKRHRLYPRYNLLMPALQGYKYVQINLSIHYPCHPVTLHSISFENNPSCPFVIPCNYTFLGRLNNKYLPIYDAPAGKHGFVIEKNGKLYFNATNKRARFWGIQTHRGGIIFDNETNEKIIDRIVKHGYNLIKITAPAWYWYNESWRDWYDRFFAKMKEKGIYGYIQLAPICLIYAMGTNSDAVSYYISNYGNFTNSTFFYTYNDKWPFGGREFNACIFTLDNNITKFIKNWFSDILNHTNPYTGKKYKEEEAIVAIEITNENSLTEKWYKRFLNYSSSIPEYYQNIFDEKWREWLKEKYNNNFTLLNETWDDGTGIVFNNETNFSNLMRYPDFSTYPPQQNPYSKTRTNDLGLFYMHLEEEFFTNISSYIRNEIGTKQLIICTQVGSNPLLFLDTVQKIPSSINDFHSYYDLPVAPFYEKLVESSLRESCIENKDPFMKGWADPIFTSFSNYGIKGKPLSRSEVNWAFTNEHSYMFIPGLIAYTQLQDVDMIISFSYMWQQYYDTPWYHEGRITGASSINPTPNVIRIHSNPAILTQNVIAYISFMRKDIDEARNLEINYSKQFFEKNIADYMNVYTPWQFLENKRMIDESIGLIYKVEKNFSSNNATMWLNYSQKNETYICNDVIFSYGNRFLLVDNPYIKLYSGKLVNISSKEFEILPKYPTYGSIMISSLTDDDIKNSSKILVTAVGRVANYGMQFEPAGNYQLAWGDKPVIAETINATIKIRMPNLCSVKIYALNETGERKEELKAKINNGWLIFDINENYSTLWYEINFSKYFFNLYYGWNMVTLPYENNYNASILYSKIKNCEAIVRWNASKQRFEIYVPSCPYDFKMENGVGYLIGVSNNEIYPIYGIPIRNVSIPLKIGWNFLGWFKENSTNASFLYNNITACKVVLRWNASIHDFDLYVGASSYDFEIRQGEGFFVAVTEESTWYA